MNQQPILTDDLLETMLARRAGPGAPVDLAAAIGAELAAQPDGRRPWWSVLAPPVGRSPTLRLTWIVALVGLLLAATVSAVLVGSQLLRRSNELTVVPQPTTVVQDTDILATTRAKPLPAQAACPPGSDPDAAGPRDQERQGGRFAEYGAMAFDRRAGRIVVLGTDEQPSPRTWTFDVCTNTWQRMDPPKAPPVDDPVTLVYDADSDRTLAFTSGRSVWSYDLAADRWTLQGLFPEVKGGLLGWVLGPAAVYHDPSGLVIVYDGESVWAYDVETNTMTAVRQQPDPSRPVGSGLPDGATAIVYDRDRDLLLVAVAAPEDLRGSSGDAEFYVANSRPFKSWVETAMLEIWAFDPNTGSWRLVPSEVPAGVLWQPDGYFYGPVSRAAFDEASGVTVFMSSDGWVEAYDGRRSWRALPSDGPSAGQSSARCDSLVPVFDPLNGRIVCQVAEGGVSAITTGSGEWRWLLEPESSATEDVPPTAEMQPTVSPTPAEPAEQEAPHALEPVGEPVVAETALGKVTWQVYGRYLQGVVGTPHGPVTATGTELLWLSPAGTVERTTLPEEPWGLLPVGDRLMAYNSAQGYGNAQAWPITWDGSRWVVGDELDVPPSLVGSSSTEVRVAAGPRGTLIVGYDVAAAADGQHFVTATQRPGGDDKLASKIGPILATPDGFVALVATGQSQFDDDPLLEPVPWVSADGLTWEPAAAASPFGAGAWIWEVAGREGRYVAVGEFRTAWTIWVSDDGLTWERLPDPGLGRNRSCSTCPIGVTASDAGWVIATGKHQSLWASADGRTWEPLTVPGVSIEEGWGFLPEVALGGDTIVVGGDLSPAGWGSAVGTIAP